MAQQNKRLTVIVVPDTARKTYSFTLAPGWLVLLTTTILLLTATLGTGLWYYYDRAAGYQSELAELEELRKTARLQQAEIDAMKETAKTVQERLLEVEQLERQIRNLTGEETAPLSRSGEARIAPRGAGRGGPDQRSLTQENLPTLGSVLPAELRSYIIGRRETLELDLKLGSLQTEPTRSIETAQLVRAAMTEQISALERYQGVLGEGREEIAAHLEFLAHLPTGWPVWNAIITDRFGVRWSPFGWGQQDHNGIDFAADYWTPIYAAGDGIVVHAGWKSGGFGNAVMIEHGYGLTTLYAHMVDWNVSYGEEVKRGDLIGWVGNTGLSTGPHLHYEVHLYGVPVDPADYLS